MAHSQSFLIGGCVTKKNEELFRQLLDEVAKDAFGRTFSEAEKNGTCVSCGLVPESFRDEPSKREWFVTRLCQKCQDDIYNEEDGSGPQGGA